METQVITIDGPTSSGKNSVGFLLSQKLGYQYIDSGSIYRAGCIFILRNKVSLDDLEKLVGVFKNLQIDIKPEDHEQRFFANGEDVTGYLHDPDVTRIVAPISAIRLVREATKIIQYRLVRDKNTVMTGRDIGSEIFPEAKHKFFLTASVEVRAKRRFKQLVQKDSSVKYEDVLKRMEERDKQDSEREVSPLRIPKDATVIDNSNLTIEQTVEEILKHISNVIASYSPAKRGD
ncbi:MAG: (d)CMP kinase [Candidatus Daviesbacteria bacterium]|nr:(d)CMP kinase [Candidatus Daviesbacteria bacterium]